MRKELGSRTWLVGAVLVACSGTALAGNVTTDVSLHDDAIKYAPVMYFHKWFVKYTPTWIGWNGAERNPADAVTLWNRKYSSGEEALERSGAMYYVRIHKDGGRYRFRYCFYYINDCKTPLGYIPEAHRNPAYHVVEDKISEHYNDWEWIDVIVPDLEKKPSQVIYYAHQERFPVDFDDVRYRSTYHPEVLVLSDMHGSYPEGEKLDCWDDYSLVVGEVGGREVRVSKARAEIAVVRLAEASRARAQGLSFLAGALDRVIAGRGPLPDVYSEVEPEHGRVSFTFLMRRGRRVGDDHEWVTRFVSGGGSYTKTSTTLYPDKLAGFPYTPGYMKPDF